MEVKYLKTLKKQHSTEIWNPCCFQTSKVKWMLNCLFNWTIWTKCISLTFTLTPCMVPFLIFKKCNHIFCLSPNKSCNFMKDPPNTTKYTYYKYVYFFFLHLVCDEVCHLHVNTHTHSWIFTDVCVSDIVPHWKPGLELSCTSALIIKCTSNNEHISLCHICIQQHNNRIQSTHYKNIQYIHKLH